ncbi:MAG TPA: ribose-phosphate pyrophosphokinase [Pyrinomonadaceae bacterium]
MAEDFIVFSGTANRPLAERVAGELGRPLGACTVEHFSDGEVFVRLDESVRGREVFVVQPTSPPVNEHLVELLAFADACRRASAARVTAVVPYFGYSRSDKRQGERVAVAASMVADLLQTVGVDHVVTVDVHAAQVEGFFRVPFDNLSATPLLANSLRARLPEGAVVVSPDAGRVTAASEFADCLGTEVVVLQKRRTSGTETEVTHIVGDVKDRACLIIDDMISTGGTIAKSVEALVGAGARPEFIVAATHGLFVGQARRKLSGGAIKEIVVTDTVAVDTEGWPGLRVVSVAPLVAAAMRKSFGEGEPERK